MAEASKIGIETKNRARLRLQGPRPRPLAELASSSYSAFVGAMKVVLPAIAVGLVLLVLAWPQFRSAEEGFHIGVANITPEDVQNLRMINPRYQGIDKKGEPFTITALWAIKAKPSSDVIELEKPQSDITLNHGNWVTLRADYGVYREQDQILDLIGGVDLFHDAGYEFRTLNAEANLATNTAEGDDPVHGQGPFGEIQSEGFRIYDKGDRVLFTGKAHLVLRPRAEPPTGAK
jgi:lipopolysaccharide export system protein LptC